MQNKNDSSVKMKKDRPPRRKLLRRVCIACLLIAVCGVCLYYKDSITVENIAALVPENKVLAAGIMLLLFAVKSLVVFVYSGILYAVDGILFPLPAAIALNIAGAVLMIAIPYFVGQWCGRSQLETLVGKYPALKKIRAMQNGSPFLVVLLVRIIGIVPATLVGIYFGACGSRFVSYLAASLVGMLPVVLSFSVMGTSIQDVTSPAFLIAAGFECAFVLASFCISVVWRRKTPDEPPEIEE